MSRSCFDLTRQPWGSSPGRFFFLFSSFFFNFNVYMQLHALVWLFALYFSISGRQLVHQKKYTKMRQSIHQGLRILQPKERYKWNTKVVTAHLRRKQDVTFPTIIKSRYASRWSKGNRMAARNSGLCTSREVSCSLDANKRIAIHISTPF